MLISDYFFGLKNRARYQFIFLFHRQSISLVLWRKL